jgi:hypothetical protein
MVPNDVLPYHGIIGKSTFMHRNRGAAMEFFLPLRLEDLRNLSDEEVVKRINDKIAPDLNNTLTLSFRWRTQQRA